MTRPDPGTDGTLDLAADCPRCFALCCVFPAPARSADFAIDKPARHACPNLATDFGCAIHSELRPRGFAGCTTYDCFGAGQHVAQVTFGGHDWRESPAIARSMFDAFPVMRALHELLWYLTEAETLCRPSPPSAPSLRNDVTAVLRDVERLTDSTVDQLVALDVEAVRGRANQLLSRVSEGVRISVEGRRPDHRGADLIGARLRGSDLRGANLRGAYLIGADLRAADLGLADVTGADLRTADLRGADLSTTIFLLQSQLDAARGDQTTRLPTKRVGPAHWTTE